MFRKLIDAWIGRRLWIKINKTNKISNNDVIILFPSENRDYNYLTLFYLERFLQYKGHKRAIILSFDIWVKTNYSNYTEKGIYVDFKKKSAKQLIKFYSLYGFTSNLIIASLDEPYGRKSNIKAKKEIEKDEIFRSIVFGQIDF